MADSLNAATQGLTWTRLQPFSPHGSNDVTFANGKFYTSATPFDYPITRPNAFPDRILHSSTDGIVWTREPSQPFWTNYSTVRAFGDDLFVNFIYDAAWIRADGSTEFLPGISRSSIADITVHNGEYFAAFYHGTNLLRSPNGSDWHEQPGPKYAFHIASGGGILVATGSKGIIARSENGVDWEEIDSGATNTLWRVIYGGGLFLVGGTDELLTSADGRQWKKIPVKAGRFYDLHYANDLFVAGGTQGLATSRDTLNWSIAPFSLGSLGREISIAFGNGLWIVRTFDPSTIISNDGYNWERIFTPTGAFREMIWRDDLLIAATGSIWTSPDSIAWTERRAFSYEYFDVAESPSMIVAVSRVLRGPAYSTNGLQWTETTLREWMRGVAYGNGVFVGLAGTYGVGTYISPDGINWSKGAFPLPNAQQAITFGAGKFVVSDRGGVIHTSTDGLVWVVQASGATTDITSLSFANNLFIATGPDGLILTSPDAIQWTRRDSHTTHTLARAAFGHGVFVLVGDQGATLTSVDGANWTGPTFHCIEPLYSVVALPDRFIAAGDYGVVLSSGYLGPTRFKDFDLSATALELTIQGQIGMTQQIQTRRALDSDEWTDVVTFEQMKELELISLPVPTGQAFYRVTSSAVE